ncbi:hypothetical protein T265_09479 [Opisthorchis viverrini]|uniref:TRAF-type domain-containing protein n=1 Tax=Opisthorchis viverrini TaxID=6198 RepID=A0A074Z5T5_OPIVI|nr:hypothetical protein T265_09479 [Opisthorchis viverrini]KER22433.1 hypothetical protein T265_09479 [Opisthorchis viverrini]
MDESTFCTQHCLTCIKAGCVEATEQCTVARCPNECGAQMHRCKMDEHVELICPRTKTFCINRTNGCQARMERQKLSQHLIVCPASVIYCAIRCCIRPKDYGVREETTHIHVGSKRNVSPFVPPFSPAPQISCNVDGDHRSEYLKEPQEREKELEAFKEAPLTDKLATLQFVDRCSSVLDTDGPTQYRCGKVVPRSNYQSHQQFHHDVLTQLDIMIEQKCPLYAYGCPFIVNRLRPNHHIGRLSYSPTLNRFVIGQYDFVKTPITIDKAFEKESSANKSNGWPRSGFPDNLPIELVDYLTRFLDDMTLVCLNQVSCRLNEITRSAIANRLIVTPKWHRVIYRPSGTASWRVKKLKWALPERTPSVTRWCYGQASAEMARHLDHCPYNIRAQHSNRFVVQAGEHPKVQPLQ